MAIYIGNNSLSAAKLGTTNISSIWLGDVKLWPTIVYYKFQAEYSDGTTYDVECDGSGTLGTSQTKPSGYEYSAMTEAIIGDCVTQIGDNAFANLSSLTTVSLPSGITNLGASAFLNCVSLENLDVSNCRFSYIYGQTFKNCASLKSITLPSTVTRFYYDPFMGCSSLSSITLSDRLTDMSYNTFKGCSSLLSVTVPSGVTQLGSSTFEGCTSLSSVTLPDRLTTIGANSFKNCTSLSSITIPNSVTSLYGSSFLNCTSLSSIVLPSGITSIGENTFNGCSSLSSVTLPQNLQTVSTSAFQNCSGLTSIEFPSTIRTFQNYAFSGCPMTSVTFNGTTPPYDWNGTSFELSYLTAIYVPCEAVETYKKNNYFKYYGLVNLIQPIPNSCPKTLQWVTFNSMDDITSDMEIYGVRGTAYDLSSTFTNGDDVINFDLSRNDVNINIDFGNCYSDTVYKTDNVELIFSDLGCNDYYQLNYDVLAGGTIQLYIYA